MTAQILVVDDLDANRDMLSRRLKQLGYSTRQAASGHEALQALHESSFDLVLLDLMMPEMDGYTVLLKIKQDPAIRHIPVIMISANDEIENVIRCIEQGAEDYLAKPINFILMRARVGASLQKKRHHDRDAAYQAELERRVRDQVREVTSAQCAAIFAMSKLAESRITDSGSRLERMREYSRALSLQLSRHEKYHTVIDASFIDAIHAASPLHDIGKVAIPDHVLSDVGKQQATDWEILKLHTVIGGKTLRAVDAQHPGNLFIRMGIEIVEGHHEKWDGSGYPYGLRGESIPLAARIVALADTYDMLTSPNSDNPAFPHEMAVRIISEGSGRQFDPDVVQAFMASEGEFIRIRQGLKDAERQSRQVEQSVQMGVS